MMKNIRALAVDAVREKGATQAEQERVYNMSRQRQRQIVLESRGLCHVCADKAAPNRKRCKACLKKQSKRSLAYYRKNKVSQ